LAVNNFNNFVLEFVRSSRQLGMSVREIDEIVSCLSQSEKTEALDDLLLKASVILDDGFLSWQVFVALQHQALLSSGFSPPPRARAPRF
jgi:DNA-binding transcriptional MerR regulator